jgi:hypothetical protein
MINWLAYRNRHPMVYWLGAAVIGLAGAFFAINALTALYSVITGNVSSLLWVFLFVCFIHDSFTSFRKQIHVNRQTTLRNNWGWLADVRLRACQIKSNESDHLKENIIK